MDEWLDGLRKRWGTLALLAGLLLGLWWWQRWPIPHSAGILAPLDPVQTAPESRVPWTFRNHRITPLARFGLRARVLGTERYRFDRAAELSPVDFALGWGPMSDSRILDAYAIQQRDRWYLWHSSRMPISRSEVTAHSANMHMIPANGTLEKRLLSVKPGQIITLRGLLIRADAPDGWHWISSLSRTDSGEGSCEVVWVEAVEVSDR